MTRTENSPIASTLLVVASAMLFFFLAATGAEAALDCPKQNDPISPSIVCTGSNYWCGGTCQPQPTCPGGTGDPYGVKPERNCTSCVCACPTALPNDCTASNQQCQANNATCADAHRVQVCSTVPGVTVRECGACLTGYFDCTGTCEPTTDPSCPAPGYWDPCLKKCVEKYILSNPTPAQSPQPVNAKVQGDMSMADGNLVITSALGGKGDIFVSSGKAMRADGAGITDFNFGNWGGGATGFKLNLFGELCLDSGTACRSYWPLGLPEAAAANTTLRYDGANWIASSLLINDGTNIGIGTATPAKNLDISGQSGGVILRLNQDTATPLWVGQRLDRQAVEKWFVGLDDTSDRLLFRSTVAGVGNNRLIVDPSGNVGVGSPVPSTAGRVLMVTGTDAQIILNNPSGTPRNRYMRSIGGAQTFGRMSDDLSSGAEHMRIASTGNVGIGTNDPQKNLDIRGGAGGVIARLDDGTGGTLWTGLNLSRSAAEKWFIGMDATTDKLLFRLAGSSNPMIIDTTGNVGIGSATPAQKLDVGGTVQMTSFKMPTGATLDYILTSDASGVGTWQKRPVGLPETASPGDTLRYDGAVWINSDLLYNNASRIGIGETAPGFRLDIGGTTTDLPIVRLHDPAGTPVWTGLQLDRDKGSQKWFIGLNDTDDKLRLRRASSSDDVVIDTAGNVGIGSTVPDQKLDVAGTVQMNSFKMPAGATADYVLTTDASGVGTWRSILFADACTGGKFDHLTAGTYDGNQTSYANANSYCGADQHVCTPDEILRSVYCTGAMPLPASGQAWVANGPPGFTSPASNDCAGFTSNAASSYGAFWQFTGAGGGKGFATSCALKLKFACCKQ